MNSETINQAYLFLIFILNGIVIGIIFDIFRILRRSFNTSNFITCVEDVLFWIISALIFMYSLFVFNNGEFRMYIFIGLFIGVAIYMLFLSKIIVDISVKVILFIKKIIGTIFNIITYPLKITFKFIKKIFINPIVKIFTKLSKFLVKNIKKFYNSKKNTKNHKILQNKEGF